MIFWIAIAVGIMVTCFVTGYLISYIADRRNK